MSTDLNLEFHYLPSGYNISKYQILKLQLGKKSWLVFNQTK